MEKQKIFDRTFCILIDEDDWTEASNSYDETDDSDTSSTATRASMPDLTEFGEIDYEGRNASNSLAMLNNTSERPTYYQFYTTVSLKPHYEEATTASESSSEWVDSLLMTAAPATAGPEDSSGATTAVTPFS